MRRKQWDQALAMLAESGEARAWDDGHSPEYGLVKYRTGDYLGALEPFASVVREQPDSQQARYLLGLCHLLRALWRGGFPTLSRFGLDSRTILCTSTFWDRGAQCRAQRFGRTGSQIACWKSAGRFAGFI